MQLLAVFPLIYYVVKRFPVLGTLFMINMNILYEYAVIKGVISSSFHRLCSIRLLTGVILGILIYRYAEELKKTVIPYILFLTGLVFLLYHNFGGYKTQFVTSWICNSFICMAYSSGIVFLLYHEKIFCKN